MLLSLLPTALTIGRLLAAIGIYAAIGLGMPGAVFPLYILGGITDALDGYLARRLRATSELGRKLDSIADYLFFGSTPIWLLLTLPEDIVAELVKPFGILLAASIMYGIVRLRHPATYFHLPSAKVGAIATFICGALLLGGMHNASLAWIAVSIVIIAELEEIARIVGINRSYR